ncbi:MAG TPA: FAD-binding oxidoreductase [Candidatus Acidoferrum sp.]|nr:FAD-binding oxidoreductase [Candidatus Acidoferrum sp.]
MPNRVDQLHQQVVDAIATHVRSFYQRRLPFRVYRGATNSTRVVEFEKDKMVDVSSLDRILSVDTQNKIVVAEANVPMDQLVGATLPHGLVPPVVMEFPGITVGGGLQGGAGESSSFKWGTFNRTLEWFEMILADGSVVRASRTEHTDLFWGAAGAYGTLGVVTAVAVRLVPAKKFVELNYQPVGSFDEAVQSISEACAAQPDFVDGIMFSKTQGVILIGRLCDESSAAQATFTKARDEWFYLHAQKMLQPGQNRTEKIPLYDYLFRYDRGAFWMGTVAFKWVHAPFNRLMRWLFDPLLHTRKMYEGLQAGGVSQECIIQDVAMPGPAATDFMEYVDKRFGIYPLWLCPLLTDQDSPLLSSYLSTDYVINIGVWGKYTGSYESFITANEELEAKVAALHGRKWLYAHIYYDEAAFWAMYDPQRQYQALRHKYKAETLPTVYQKVHVTQRYRVSVKWGILSALLGRSGIRRR